MNHGVVSMGVVVITLAAMGASVVLLDDVDAIVLLLLDDEDVIELLLLDDALFVVDFVVKEPAATVVVVVASLIVVDDWVVGCEADFVDVVVKDTISVVTETLDTTAVVVVVGGGVVVVVGGATVVVVTGVGGSIPSTLSGQSTPIGLPL